MLKNKIVAPLCESKKKPEEPVQYKIRKHCRHNQINKTQLCVHHRNFAWFGKQTYLHADHELIAFV